MKAVLLAAAVGASISLVVAHPHPEAESTIPTCGVKGYDKAKPRAYSYVKSSAKDWEAACVVSCLLDSKCKSFAIGTGECLLYSSTLYVLILQ